MSLIALQGIALLTAAALMVGVWVGSLAVRDASIVDRFWGLGFVLVAAVAFVVTDSASVRKTLVLALVTLWGVRLSVYITWRNWGEGEDYRYREMREKRGRLFPLVSLVTVFLLQALLLWLVVAPVVYVQWSAGPAALGWLDVLGVVLFGTGFFFETVGDWQMARFKADPANKGKVLDTGLWRYTRHPNYFGDAVIWWAFFAFAVAAGGWWTFYGPLLMTFLLMKVSGVALLEKNLEKTKPQYREYVERTSSFFPWPPSKA